MFNPKVDETFKMLRSTLAAPSFAAAAPALNKDLSDKRVERVVQIVPELQYNPPKNFNDAFNKYCEIEQIQKIAKKEADSTDAVSRTVNQIITKEMKDNLKAIGRKYFKDELNKLDVAMDEFTQAKDSSEFGLIHFGLLSRINDSTFLDQDQKDEFTKRTKDALLYIIGNTEVLNSSPSERQNKIQKNFKTIAEKCSPQIAIKFAIKHDLVKNDPAAIRAFARQHNLKSYPFY